MIDINIIFGVLVAAAVLIILITACSILAKTDECESYLIGELPNLGETYSDIDINTYKSSHCSKCRCFNNSTDVCENTKHWGEFCGKTITYCSNLGSYERNKMKDIQ